MVANCIPPHSRGSLLVELALVLPLLVLIFFLGTLELGRVFSQVSWLAKTSYVTVVEGGGNSPGSGEIAMHHKFDQLVNIQNSALESHGNVPLYRVAEDLVQMDVSASVRTLTPRFALPISMRLVGPMLVLDPSTVGSLNNFQNPNCLYDCAGDKTACCAPYLACGNWACNHFIVLPIPPQPMPPPVDSN